MAIKDNSGNAADYVDNGAAEGDGGEGGGRRRAPLAAKSTIEALETFEKAVILCTYDSAERVGRLANKQCNCTHGRCLKLQVFPFIFTEDIGEVVLSL
ncbi:unnamed protein product [Brassica rapa]|uniref:Uncharacterized protein n=2 Tax=Brassica TaxID=3705 RepID=A0A8D9DHQ3_BRACM|nr:unnamed protein product [Brassica napus]CAF2140746.1 unnamed protein product [Brassica napus]CAG7877505.1 unnamed protein product [Brassica rapa]